jgi:hypothetical protein
MQDPILSKTPTPESIKVIRVRTQAETTIAVIQAITRGVIAVGVIGVGGYLMATGAPIPEQAWSIAFLVIGGLFGVEALAKVFQLRNGK